MIQLTLEDRVLDKYFSLVYGKFDGVFQIDPNNPQASFPAEVRLIALRTGPLFSMTRSEIENKAHSRTVSSLFEREVSDSLGIPIHYYEMMALNYRMYEEDGRAEEEIKDLFLGEHGFFEGLTDDDGGSLREKYVSAVIMHFKKIYCTEVIFLCEKLPDNIAIEFQNSGLFVNHGQADVVVEFMLSSRARTAYECRTVDIELGVPAQTIDALERNEISQYLRPSLSSLSEYCLMCDYDNGFFFQGDWESIYEPWPDKIYTFGIDHKFLVELERTYDISRRAREKLGMENLRELWASLPGEIERSMDYIFPRLFQSHVPAIST